TEMLRKKGVVGKFVEFYGPGLDYLSLEDQATIANMAPEYGATCGYFPVDADTLKYLSTSGRDAGRVALVEAYSKAQGMFRETTSADPVFTSTIELDLTTVVPSISGPKRPQDRIALDNAKSAFAAALPKEFGKTDEPAIAVDGAEYTLTHGDVVIAAITSCTNTSNPSVLVAAGLVARKARALGLDSKPWVKTSLAPGSQVVTDYLDSAGLSEDLDAIGFNLVGYGCTTCIGNSGPLPAEISKAVQEGDLVAASVLSGNRNFEGRVNPDVKANFLASPPLVVAYAIAVSMKIDITKDPIGISKDGNPVYLRDVWPTNHEVAEIVRQHVTKEMFQGRYSDVFKGDENWQNIVIEGGETYGWNSGSTYVQNPPYFEGMTMEPKPITNVEKAKVLALFLDSITTDHISPAGSFKASTPAGKYLEEH